MPLKFSTDSVGVMLGLPVPSAVVFTFTIPPQVKFTSVLTVSIVFPTRVVLFSIRPNYLSKWLVAIYMFATLSRGISSYNLSRLIGVSQPTAWKMLTKIRLNIKHDLPHTSTAIIDEVYIGADWSKKPAKDKFKHIEPPKRVWNLQGEELKKYYRGQMMSAASKDKIPVIGISDYNTRYLVLLPFLSQITRSLVKERINDEYSQLTHWISDDSKLYWWMDEEGIKHSVCDHTHHIYKSEDGYNQPTRRCICTSKKDDKGYLPKVQKRIFAGIFERICLEVEFLRRVNRR